LARLATIWIASDSSLGLGAARDDLDRLGGTRREYDVMTPLEDLGDRAARVFERCASGATVGMWRTGVADRFECLGDGLERLGHHRSDRRMVEIEALHATQKRHFPANCHMNARPYIGADAAAHPRSDT